MKFLIILLLCSQIFCAETLKEESLNKHYSKCIEDHKNGAISENLFDVIELTNVICLKFLKLDKERNDLLKFLSEANPMELIKDALKKIPVPAQLHAEDLETQQKASALDGIEMAEQRIYSIKKIHNMFESYITHVVSETNQTAGKNLAESASDFLTFAQIMLVSSKND
jgi:hypothetical protein